MKTRVMPPRRRLSLDRNIERLREQLTHMASYLGKSKATYSLEEFDLETERLISDIFGESSKLLEAYEYAQLGEAAGLVNMTDEAPESMGLDGEKQRLFQRSRVLESCISELEARRAADAKTRKGGSQTLIGPQVAEHLSPDIRSLRQDASLREAGELMQKWKTGSLLVTDNQTYVGFITDSVLAREVVAKGLDPTTTTVKTCMRTPLVAIEGDRPLIEAVRMMKEQATRHLAVTQDGEIIGVISVSNILRYYSGVV
ncbi:MAG: CBS domain-containing protein [Nitrospirae bacterium]|nr:CBS domain-containing protein [Nitrospirota bacterium]